MKFIDTNVLVYYVDRRDPAKREKARSIIVEAVRNGRMTKSSLRSVFISRSRGARSISGIPSSFARFNHYGDGRRLSKSVRPKLTSPASSSAGRKIARRGGGQSAHLFVIASLQNVAGGRQISANFGIITHSSSEGKRLERRRQKRRRQDMVSGELSCGLGRLCDSASRTAR